MLRLITWIALAAAVGAACGGSSAAQPTPPDPETHAAQDFFDNWACKEPAAGQTQEQCHCVMRSVIARYGLVGGYRALVPRSGRATIDASDVPSALACFE